MLAVLTGVVPKALRPNLYEENLDLAFLSFAEDFMSTLGTVLALVVPFFLLLCVALTGVFLIFAARRFRLRAARLRER